MDNIIELFLGGLIVPPELVFVARCLAFVTVLDVISLFISVIGQFGKINK